MGGRFFSFVLFMMSLIIWTSNASEHLHNSDRYFLELYGEKLSDGSQVYIRYDVTLLRDQKEAQIKITTWHAPISCEGDYSIETKDGMFILKYLGTPDKCIYSSPQFYIMKKGGDIYIKGSPLVYGQGDWQRLSLLK